MANWKEPCIISLCPRCKAEREVEGDDWNFCVRCRYALNALITARVSVSSKKPDEVRHPVTYHHMRCHGVVKNIPYILDWSHPDAGESEREMDRQTREEYYET